MRLIKCRQCVSLARHPLTHCPYQIESNSSRVRGLVIHPFPLAPLTTDHRTLNLRSGTFRFPHHHHHHHLFNHPFLDRAFVWRLLRRQMNLHSRYLPLLVRRSSRPIYHETRADPVSSPSLSN